MIGHFSPPWDEDLVPLGITPLCAEVGEWRPVAWPWSDAHQLRGCYQRAFTIQGEGLAGHHSAAEVAQALEERGHVVVAVSETAIADSRPLLTMFDEPVVVEHGQILSTFTITTLRIERRPEQWA